jgi:hypothetical protein
MQALEAAGHARDYKPFDIPTNGKQPAGVGCRCTLDTGVTIIAHCLLPIESNQALIRLGKEKRNGDIDSSGIVENRYPELDPGKDGWRGYFQRPLDFITKEASKPIPD